MHLQHAETATPARSFEFHDMDGRDVLSIPLDAPALEPGMERGLEDAEVLARVRTIQGGGGSYLDRAPAATLLVVRGDDGAVEMRAVSPYDSTLESHTLPPRLRTTPRPLTTDSGAPDVRYAFTAGAGKHDAPVLHIAAAHPKDHLRVTTAAGAVPGPAHDRRLESIAESNQRHATKRWMTRAIGAGLLLAAVAGGDKTGHAVDTVMDSVTRADSVVLLHAADTEKEQQAVERVGAAMQALDDHDDAAIEAGADAFLQERLAADDIMPPETVPLYTERIQKAGNTGEILHAIDGFMRFYDKRATLMTADDEKMLDYDPTTDVESLRQTALGIVDAYSGLPRSYIMDGRYDRLEFGAPKYRTVDGQTGYSAGVYSRSTTDSSIQIAVMPRPFDGQRQAAANTALHEDTHGHQIDLDGETGQPLGTVGSVVLRATEAVGLPHAVSDYAAAGNGAHEAQAEARAQVLAGHGANQAAHPDDHREFISQANFYRTDEMVALEKRFPGFTFWMIRNSGLAGQGQR